MRYVAAYLLASLNEEGKPNKEKIISILDSVGIDVDDEKLSKVMSELEGKDISELIANGMGKLASMPSGGAVGASAKSGDGVSGGAPVEEEKEEKKEESEEESDDDMGFGLFD